MAKRQRLRFSAMNDVEPKSLEREETKSLELNKTESIKQVPETVKKSVAEVKLESTTKPQKIKKSKKIGRNYKFDGDLLEKFDALMWQQRKVATVIMTDAMKKVVKSVTKEELEAAMKTFHASEDYKVRGDEYYYNVKEI